MTAEIDHYEVVHSFDGDDDFIVYECMRGDEWIERLEDQDNVITLTGDMGFQFF